MNTVKDFKVGDVVLWNDSHYTIVSLNNKGALLKQNFSIGITLNGLVPIEELSLDNEKNN